MDWRTKSVLIAEDEETNFMLLSEYLEPTGIKIFQARNGLEVLDSCNKNKPNIVLLDMKMPIMSGYEAAIKLKEKHPEIIIISQTAYAMVGDREKLLAIGINDYLAKPIHEDDLILMMTKYLG